MTHHYKLISIIARMILFIITFGPISFICYSVCHHWWGFMTLGILLQILSIFLLFVYLMSFFAFWDKGPGYEFVEPLLNEVNYFYKRGYDVKELFGNGSFHPGVRLTKTGMPEITLIYDYQPFKYIFSTTLIIEQYGRQLKYQYDNCPDMKKFSAIFDKWFGLGDPNIQELSLLDFSLKSMRRWRRRTEIPRDKALVITGNNDNPRPQNRIFMIFEGSKNFLEIKNPYIFGLD